MIVVLARMNFDRTSKDWYRILTSIHDIRGGTFIV